MASRRASYGNTETLGVLGTRSRTQILSAARAVFAERGYHAVTVEDIGARAGRTAAGVYQYFASKGEIFAVFAEQLATELLRHASRLGELGPTERGFDELRTWLGGLGLIFHRHTFTFELYAAAAADAGLSGADGDRFNRRFTDRVASRFPESIPVEVAADLALVVLSTSDWAHSLHGLGWPCDEAELNETWARLLQLTLFPSTTAVLDQLVHTWSPPSPPPEDGAASGTPTQEWIGLRRPVSPRALKTVTRIVNAAETVLMRRGLQGMSMAEVAAEAGVRYSSVYTYWANREDLAATVSNRACQHLGRLLGDVPASVTAADPSAALQAWLQAAMADYPRYCGAVRMWAANASLDPRIEADRATAARAGARALRAVMTCSPHRHLFGPTALPLVLVALLQSPSQAPTAPSFGADNFVAALMLLVGRGLLGLEVPSAE
ncbi:MAG TPA: TetR/AcrR family transcriptional regulator [Mycobacteriales bacterium]|nr:TetR/AcrR family transcriptional regulator [Mycobacteriales bacterium]